VSQVESSGEAAIRMGVSSCLLGKEVRFDGGHKRDRFMTDLLGRFVEWVPVCPEVEVGMGTPRPALRLVGGGDDVRMVEIKSRRDHTRAMRTYSARRVRALRALDLCGYVFKKDSPSCGMTRVKIYPESGMPRREGRGLYASALMEAFPNLPVEDEGRLNDAKLRENFIERVFAYQRVQGLFRARWTAGQVVDFHTAHKLQLMAHSRAIYDKLGRQVANVTQIDPASFASEYQRNFMEGLAVQATRGRNTNVLQHAAGHLSHLDGASRQELASVIHDYRQGLVPLIVCITLLRHHTRVGDVAYLNGQTFLEPHPRELMLRNHV
jgi:uncharacterized protein YbgA (DUF1722 family)/uncharacterized protein YbbK (DUF523 family)